MSSPARSECRNGPLVCEHLISKGFHMDMLKSAETFFAQHWVHSTLWAIVLVVITATVAKIATRVLRHILRRDDNPLPSSTIFVNIVRTAIWLLGGSVILDNCFGINANAFVAALGVGGIAISLGFQDTLSNLIGGLQVSFMRIVTPGDHIEVGGKSGVVQDVTWRHTTIRDAYDQTIVIPNSTISKNTLVHLLPAGRVSVPIALPNGKDRKDLDALAEEIKEATIGAVANVCPLNTEPKVYFFNITEHGITGNIVFEVADSSKTFQANDACVRAVAPLLG